MKDVGKWSTVGDARVCGLCDSLEGKVIEIEEVRGLIPRYDHDVKRLISIGTPMPPIDTEEGS